jgi:YNFM family putative membrane transporter
LSEATPSALRSDQAKIAISCVTILLAVTAVFMTQSIFLEISQSFEIQITEARHSFSVVSLFYAISFLFLGPAADKYDLPKIAVTGLTLLGLSVLFASYAPRFSLFLVAMGFMGFSAALIPASMFPYVSIIAPDEKRGVYVGSIVACGILGVILGRVSMGLLTQLMGWHSSFRIVAAVIFGFAVLSYLVLREKKPKEPNTKKLLSLYKNAIDLILDPKTLSLLLAGCGLFFGFLGMVTFLTYRLVAAPFNFTSGEVGWISFAGLSALIAPFAGGISKKIGEFKIIFISLLVCILSLQLMGWFDSILSTALGLLLLFLGVYSCQPLLFLVIGESVSRNSLGSASSLYIFFCIGSGSLSSILLGPVWTAYGWTGITLLCSLSLLIALLLMVYIKSCGLGHTEEA